MPLAVPVRRGRRQAVPGLVEQLASEDKGPRYVGRRLALTGIGVEAFLHRLPEVGRNDPLMLSRVYLALVGDLTGVDRVVQHLVKVAARERQPAAESAAILMALGDQPEVIGFLFEKVDAAQLQASAVQPIPRWDLMQASQASRWAWSELNSCSSPSSVDFLV